MSLVPHAIASWCAGVALIAVGLNGAGIITAKMSLPQIVERLEQDGYGPFSEISFDHGCWEMEVQRQNDSYEIKVEPESGKILAKYHDDPDQLPPADAKLLSGILKQISDAGYVDIQEVGFERRYWEIEARMNDGTHEIRVDPLTGEVISDRLDD